MKAERVTEFPESTRPSRALADALVQNEHVETLVRESASDLATATETLKKQDVEAHAMSRDVTAVLAKTEAVENKMHDASEKLTSINQALETQVRNRNALDDQMAEISGREAAARLTALHDALTGLPNRVLFSDRLEHELAHARRHDEHLAVLFVDLDDFKIVNDTYGHEAGDGVLRTIAQRLTEATREIDTVSRYGGDEFLIVLSEIQDETMISAFAEKIIGTIREPCPIARPGFDVRHPINASVGIALFPRHGLTADALMHSADMAMYRAKLNKSGFAFADPDPRPVCWESPAANGKFQPEVSQELLTMK